MKSVAPLIAVCLLLTSPSLPSSQATPKTATTPPLTPPCQSKPVIHAVEPVILLSKPPLRLKARIDTGATLSSIDQKLALKLGFNQAIRKISVRNAHGTTIRQVVKIPFLLKGQKRLAEFTLAERHNLDYAVLLGRSSLNGFLVDPGPLPTGP
ncbi:MAG: RimK/LysX family protein [Candidatus Sericytochromatia bacterium]